MHPSFTLRDLTRHPSALDALQPPARLAVFGDPVAHSLSPQMHNPALKACGIDAQYVRVHVRPDEFRDALTLVRDLKFIGVNCTIPHKFAALEAVDDVDPAARRLGAVNTIIFRPDGTMLGRNSDGPGFLRTVQEEFGQDVRHLRIFILGAGGGAGRAVAVQCAVQGCAALFLANRTPEKAETVRASLHDLPAAAVTCVLPWTAEGMARTLPDVDLIVNATSLGMNPNDPPLVPPGALEPRHLVYDMVYKPHRTALIAAAEIAGARAINGLPMLLWQGVYSFEWWFDRPAPVAAMRDGLASAVE